MRRAIPLVALALVIGAVLPGTAIAAVGGSDLPVRGTHSGYCTLNLATGETHCLTTGVVSYFGLSTVEQDLQQVPTGPGTFSWSGTWTLTAASGDELSGTASGTSSTADGIHVVIVGEWVSTAGTGRLNDASVTLDATAHGTRLSVVGGLLTEAMEVAIDGRLSY